MGHYENLGLQRDASPEDIKLAHRKLASKYHPDREGGDEEKFKAVQRAYDILSDPKMRAHYDKHGTDETGPSIREMAMQNLASSFVRGVLDDKNDPDTENMINDLAAAVELQQASVPERMEVGRQKIARLERTKKRVISSTPENLFVGAIERQIAGINEGIKHLEREKLIGDEMLKILKDYKYEPDKKQFHDFRPSRSSQYGI